MRKYREEQTKGIFSLLVRTNLARIVWGLIILGLLFGILFAIFMPLANMPYFTLYMVRNRLIHEEFDRIDSFGITDGKGSFEIVNSEFKVIYPEEVDKSYTKEEIDAVWEVDYLRTKAKKNQYILDGELYTQIICDGNDMYDGWFLLVDESFRYVDSVNFPTIKDRYTNSDIAYYLEDMVFDRGMYKHEFITSKGQTYYMLIKFGSPAVLLDDNEIDILIYTAGGLVAIFILFIILSINSVSRKFKKPIKQLDEAMVGFSNGNYSDINLNHRGVREIATVINTFNDMVRKLQESEDENKRLSNEKQRLIADISHDLKTPITIIQGYTDALYQGKIPPDKHNDYLEKIQKKTGRLTQLINEFSYYSKIDYPSFELELKSLDLCDLTRDFMAENYAYITDNGFGVLIDIPQEKYMCDIDSTHFVRCLENIIANFIKHNPTGTNFHVSAVDYGNYFSLILENDGVRIQSDIAERLFEPFVMGDKSRRTGGGSGLGLAVVKKIVTLHGGTIEYLNNGVYVNCFRISLLK